MFGFDHLHQMDFRYPVKVILMNRIRETIARLYFVNKSNNERIDCITMSFGIAGYQAGDNFHSLFDRADKALYQSKQNGRNQVNIAD